MAGKAFRQTYYGRVIFPAKYHASEKGDAFLTFVLYVDGLHVTRDRKRESGRLNCSYTIKGNDDPVARILCRIFSKDEEDNKGLAGQQFKSVDVIVEGSFRTAPVFVNEQLVSGATFNHLDYCNVTITDKEIIKLYRQEFGGEEGSEDSSSASTSTVQQPTRAPKQTVTQPVQQQQQAAAQTTQTAQAAERVTYEVGSRVTHEGKEYEFVGGDPSNIMNWKLVTPAPSVPFAKAPVAAKPAATQTAQASGGQQSVKSLLDDSADVNQESPLFNSVKNLPV